MGRLMGNKYMDAMLKLIEAINKEFGTQIPVTVTSGQKLVDSIEEYNYKCDNGFCPECAGRRWKGN